MTPPLLLSHGDLLGLAARAASGLAAAGVRRGAVVGLRLDTSPEAAALLVALWHLGAVAAPLSPRLPAAVLPGLLRTLGATALVAPTWAGETGVPVLHPAHLFAAPPLPLPAWPDLDLHTPATLVFTSGSTGTPKAALHTLGNHVWSARGANANIPLTRGDRWLLTLPLYHVGGLGILFRTLEAHSDLAFGKPDALLSGDITHASLVATQLYRLLREQTEKPAAALKALLLGGSAFPPALLDEALHRRLPVHTSYGLTEMASQVTTTPPGADQEMLRSSGRLLRHRELEIDGQGEIRVRGLTRFAGYQTAEGRVTPFDANGWYATGDMGFLDADGFLHVTGRRDFLFISGGENVQPEEVERALAACGVLQSAVVPVPDAEFGQRPAAFVTPEALENLPALRRDLERLLPRFKIPIAFFDFPEASGLKPDRGALARLAAHLLAGAS